MTIDTIHSVASFSRGSDRRDVGHVSLYERSDMTSGPTGTSNSSASSWSITLANPARPRLRRRTVRGPVEERDADEIVDDEPEELGAEILVRADGPQPRRTVEMPPSTGTIAPVVKAPARLARKITVPAMSAAVPILPRGTLPSTILRLSSSASM